MPDGRSLTDSHSVPWQELTLSTLISFDARVDERKSAADRRP